MGARVFKLKSGYRHYNRLMDLCFWVLLIGYGRGFLFMAGVPEQYLLSHWRPLHLAFGSFVLLMQIVLIVLILVRHLRDEYAEQLWQKAAGSLVRLLSLAPFLWIAFHFAIMHKMGWLDWLRANPEFTLIPQHALLRNPTESLGIYQFDAISFTVIKFTQYFPLAFAALYKFHRWRDER